MLDLILKICNHEYQFSIIKQQRRTRSMAKNKPYGDNQRIGAVKDRSQFQTPSGLWAKRDLNTGRIMDVKQDGTPFKGVTKEK